MVLIFGSPNGNVNPHIRIRFMGPIRYVSLNRRIRLISPTDAPNPTGSILGGFYKNKKRPKGRLLFLAAPTGIEPVSSE